MTASPAIWVSIERFEGSSPREVGAWMLVTSDRVEGTVGGGHLEFDAIAHARSLLASHARSLLSDSPFVVTEETRRYALGPSLGQCCGGVVWLKFVGVAAGDTTKSVALRADSIKATGLKSLKIALFGGGHVGKAIVNALAPLPCSVHWIDSRDEIFPSVLPANVQAEHSAPVQAAVNDLAPQSHVLIMSFSHAEDLDVVAECLKRKREQNDLPFIGLIGSKTKWATFRHRLEERGFSEDELRQVTCPIGLTSIAGKEPEVIAASVAAQLMQFRKV
ncbi:xanthine dehydrogenase accessory protein XdhC [Variovorax sp. PCZ-1]|uniref:xanthine dehydrogenase accessory protein XdhC n=1 Tax=Variovorax sp. PCZ-1 TaxID=2835533 RepID=UPI001BD1221D|nr:xanthine dehydrogenase accessory protein XdhC [Variovorax sp. PCZ-1]MBS7807936.1 xanthine dehydrogenase accessory protein XdhC [Variovorax sp. PCZ-1]